MLQFNSQGDSERRMGTYSGLLSTTQDGDSKRPKLSYTSRALQSGSSSSPLTGSTSSRISSVSGTPAPARKLTVKGTAVYTKRLGYSKLPEASRKMQTRLLPVFKQTLQLLHYMSFSCHFSPKMTYS